MPLGWLAYRFKLTRGLLLTVAGLLYTIPSLALLPILPAIFGISFLSPLNLTIALTIYAVAIMARSVADALASVDPAVRQSATAMGFGSWRRFWTVEFPLAGPVILAGLRVAAVSTISLVTVGILIGVESLGYLFTNGFAAPHHRRDPRRCRDGRRHRAGDRLSCSCSLGRVLMPWAHASPAPSALAAALGSTRMNLLADAIAWIFSPDRLTGTSPLPEPRAAPVSTRSCRC